MNKPILKTPSSMDERKLALAVIQVLQLWSHEDHKFLLQGKNLPEIHPKWFSNFLSSWQVARTIAKEHHEDVRKYLENELRRCLAKQGGAKAIDRAIQEMAKKKWGSTEGKNGSSSKPMSLVSKIGFFLCPKELIPRDSYSVKGLEELSKSKLQNSTYGKYLEIFDEHYTKQRTEIRRLLSQNWVKELAGKFGLKSKHLRNEALQRKVFDNYLMQVGGFNR